MAPTVHCVRHGQAHHNLSIANHGMRDPLLTAYGEEQCRNLQNTFPVLEGVDLVLSSPLKRTLYTALIAFEPALRAKGLNVIALPELQETSDLPCDTGSPIEKLQQEFANQRVDLTLVKPGWESKRMRWASTATAIDKRARDAREWIMRRPESEIVVVTHGGFLQFLTSAWTAATYSPGARGVQWGNAEWRSYTFSSSDPETAYLVETPESRERRLVKDEPLKQPETISSTPMAENERAKV